MSYVKSDGTFVYTEPFPAVASAARTTSSAATAYEVGNRNTLRSLTMAVTASSGTTPTLDVRVETGPDNSTWTTVGSFTQATGVTSQTKSFAGLDRYARVAWTVGGTTPSFTFSVSGAELV